MPALLETGGWVDARPTHLDVEEGGRMKKLRLVLAAAMAVPLVAGGDAGAQVPSPSGFGARGQVLMTLHTHSAGTLLFPSDRLPYPPQTGDTFAYSSRLCSGAAPFNDVALNFIPDYPGVDDDDGTAAVRHGISGTVVAAFGNRGLMRGRVETVLCVPGNSPNGQVESEHALVWYFQGTYQIVSDNEARLLAAWQFSPTESRGTFRDIQGGGVLQGRFTCLARLTNPSAPSCAQLGEFTDFVSSRGDPTLPAGQLQPGTIGAYFDPTVETVGAS